MPCDSNGPLKTSPAKQDFYGDFYFGSFPQPSAKGGLLEFILVALWDAGLRGCDYAVWHYLVNARRVILVIFKLQLTYQHSIMQNILGYIVDRYINSFVGSKIIIYFPCSFTIGCIVAGQFGGVGMVGLDDLGIG